MTAEIKNSVAGLEDKQKKKGMNRRKEFRSYNLSHIEFQKEGTEKIKRKALLKNDYSKDVPQN